VVAGRIGVAVGTLYKWCNGSMVPSRARQDRMLDELGILVAWWTEFPEGEGDDEGLPRSPRPAAPAGPDDSPSPIALWRAAHAWRLELQRKASTASAIAAAFKTEQHALQLAVGSAQQYTELVTLTASTLKEFPDALAAWNAAMAAAGL
jgi:transcriptional regulator with XRE-family HTH domain